MYSVIMPGILWCCHVPHSLILSCTVLLCQGYCGIVMYHTVLFYHVQCYYARDIVELSCTTQSYFIMYSVIMPGILWSCHVPHSLILSCTVLLCQEYCGIVMYHTVLFYHVQCYYASNIVELSCTTQSNFIMYSVIMPGILWYCHVPHSLILSCTVLLCQGYCGVVMYHTVLFYHVQCYYARDIVELSCTTQSYFIMYSVIMPGILWYCHVPHSLILSCTVLLCQGYCGVVMYHVV